jgi:hypothetical protein
MKWKKEPKLGEFVNFPVGLTEHTNDMIAARGTETLQV